MTILDIDLSLGEPITASLVGERERLETLPRVFGTQMVRGEALVYGWMQTLCASYNGGLWKFYRLSNGGFFMAPEGERLTVQVTTNGYAGEMSSEAAGITAGLFAFNQLAHRQGREQDRFVSLYHQLRDFVNFHPEATEIYRAID